MCTFRAIWVFLYAFFVICSACTTEKKMQHPEHVSRIAKKMQKVEGVVLDKISKFSEPANPHCFTFTCQKNISLDSGRALAAMIGAEFLEELKHHEANGNTFFNIIFVDQDEVTPVPPFLAQIDFFEGKLRYYQLDLASKQKRLIFEEPFEQALTYFQMTKNTPQFQNL